MIFKHFGRLFLPGTLKNVPCPLKELMVNFREEPINSGIGRFCRLGVPTDGQLAQFRFFHRNRVKCTKQALPDSYISPSFDFLVETGPVGHPSEFEPAKSANPTRFLSIIDL